MIARARAIWREGRRVMQAADDGQVVITVPRWLAAEAMQWAWERKVEHASEKWASKEADVTLNDWQAAMVRRRDQKH